MAEFGISSFQPLTSKLTGRAEGMQAPAIEAPPAAGQSSVNFMDALKNALHNVNDTMVTADKASQKFATGKAENLHDVMIAMEKADLSLRTLTAVRGKLVEAYHEIMKMPI